MNSYLLDTHILLWWLADDEKLTQGVRKLVSDPNNNIIVSAVSIWEVVIKKSLNKLDAPDDLIAILEGNNIEILPMTADHAMLVGCLPLIHSDPFDRLLIAQCMFEDLIFVTHDGIIPKYNIECF